MSGTRPARLFSQASMASSAPPSCTVSIAIANVSHGTVSQPGKAVRQARAEKAPPSRQGQAFAYALKVGRRIHPEWRLGDRRAADPHAGFQRAQLLELLAPL